MSMGKSVTYWPFDGDTRYGKEDKLKLVAGGVRKIKMLKNLIGAGFIWVSGFFIGCAIGILIHMLTM